MNDLQRREPWWTEAWADGDGPGDSESGRRMVELVDWLRDRDSGRIGLIGLYAELYHGKALMQDSNSAAISVLEREGTDRSRLNFTRNAVDFVHVKVTSETPAVMAATLGGDFSAIRRASRLTRFITAQTEELRLPHILSQCALDGIRVGTGVVKTSVVDGVPHAEVCGAETVFVDPGAARYGRPRELYQVRPVSRQSLLERFGDDAFAADAIRSAPAATRFVGTQAATAIDEDTIDVYEAWRLPREGAKGEDRGDDETDRPSPEEGRNTVAIRGCTLEDRPWECPRFPIATFRMVDPDSGNGFWGHGLIERLDPIQFEIDELLAKVSQQIRLDNLKIFVDEASDIIEDHLTDPRIGTVIAYNSKNGTKPEFVTPHTLSSEVLNHIKWLVEQIYSMAGMSEQAASSQRPAGVNSGRAILYFHDFQTQRYVEVVKRYGQLVVDVIERLIDRAKEAADIDDGGRPWVARYSNGRGNVIREIDWSDVDMDRDAFVIRLQTISPVVNTPAGRLQRIEQLQAAGKVPESYQARLLEDPNIYRYERMAAADANLIDEVIEILYDEEEVPQVFDQQNLQLTLDIVRSEMLDAIADKADPDVIDRFERYLEEVASRLAESEVPPAAAAPQQQTQALPNGGLAPAPQ